MTGLFETMLVVRGQVFQIDEHFARLSTSAEALGFPLPDEDAFRAVISHAVREIGSIDEAALRCLYVEDLSAPQRFGVRRLAAAFRTEQQKGWQLLASTGPIPPVTLRRRKGAHVVTLDRAVSRDQPTHKLTSYITSRPDIPAGADEALFVDRDGHVLEGTTTNVFAIDGSTLITAPVGAGILPGIVRGWVLENASNVIERPPTIDELRAGSFLTSSLTLFAPIVTLDGMACVQPGRAFEQLRKLY